MAFFHRGDALADIGNFAMMTPALLHTCCNSACVIWAKLPMSARGTTTNDSLGGDISAKEKSTYYDRLGCALIACTHPFFSQVPAGEANGDWLDLESPLPRSNLTRRSVLRRERTAPPSCRHNHTCGIILRQQTNVATLPETCSVYPWGFTFTKMCCCFFGQHIFSSKQKRAVRPSLFLTA